MPKKFGTILDEKILEQARGYCKKQNTTISHLMEEALVSYLKREDKKSSPFSTVEASFGVLKVPSKVVQSVLTEDFYETQ